SLTPPASVPKTPNASRSASWTATCSVESANSSSATVAT
uniref:Copper-containing nitrite reductase n=1 Tax=Bursaphelenchus xylophilus TaxID=6326 RepID=A0A1I7SNF8_BURXY